MMVHMCISSKGWRKALSLRFAVDNAINIVELKNVSKMYTVGGRQLFAINNVDLDIRSGEYVAIYGPSGSGKTTLLNIIGLMDRASDGTVIMGGQRTELLND